MVVVIADAGPLIALAKINQLTLLRGLFTGVVITQAVADECLRRQSPDAALIEQALTAGWLKRVDNPPLTQALSRSLGLGEQTSIEYALQNKGDHLLIIDDVIARKQAFRLNLCVVGTAALLFAAQRKHLIADADELIGELRQVGYRISAEVVTLLQKAYHES